MSEHIMDGKKGFKLHSIIEKLSEQCGRADDDDEQGDEQNSSSLTEDTTQDGIVVVNLEPVERKSFLREKKTGRFTRYKKRKTKPGIRQDDPNKPKRKYKSKNELLQDLIPSSCGPVSLRTRSTLRNKNTFTKSSEVCQPVDEDLCIDVTALMCITPQVKDIDNDHSYSCVRPTQTQGGTCRLCLMSVRNTQEFINHFKNFHSECIKKPKKAASPSPESEEEEELNQDSEPDETDSDYDPALDPDMLEVQNAILQKRKSPRLSHKKSLVENTASQEVNNNEKDTVVKLALEKLPSSRKSLCRVCKEKFYFKIELTAHMNDEHSISDIGSDDLECEHCKKVYPSKENLLKHIKKVVKKIEKIKKDDEFYDILEYEDDCDRILEELQQKKLLQRYKCDQCDKKFVYPASLNKHKASHSEDRPFGCKKCGKGFKNKEYLRRHLETHAGEKRYQCDLCNVKLAHRGSLRSHRMIHTGERPYKCRYCDGAFISSTLRKDHENAKHLDIKPYNCPVCSKAFAKNNHLKMHMISHSNDKPFPCEVCGKAFKRRDHLRYHLIIHSDNKPFKCDTCGRTFNQHICLRKHLPCRELERQAKKKAKDLAESSSKPKKPKPIEQAQQESQPTYTGTSKNEKQPKSSSRKKSKKSKSLHQDVSCTRKPSKTPLNQLIPDPDKPDKQDKLAKPVQPVLKDKSPEKEKVDEDPKQNQQTTVGGHTQAEKQHSNNPDSVAAKNRLSHHVECSSSIMPYRLDQSNNNPQKETPLNFDRLDFSFQGPAVNVSSPGTFNVPMQRLLESTYMSQPSTYIPNVTQTFIPFNCSAQDTQSSVVFENGGLEMYQSVGNHDNMRSLCNHDNMRSLGHDDDLSSALLAAMDPNHLNNIVNSAAFYPQT